MSGSTSIALVQALDLRMDSLYALLHRDPVELLDVDIGTLMRIADRCEALAGAISRHVAERIEIDGGADHA
ncbi:hypothetical protein Lcho_2191 [Leptothrix cholodnii SP-6]|uniref:Uncharacterized protein n=1 Tax=Leptothrix cholodnii (strain ATCC 51168 / LMG 8142 / SP-6) TaxID=395495 RepID=B1Y3C9_LEPCP|nr:hypothetical protein [Leptothrix cholodnii]ACB34457.1 hypothetical protein Lcho_2191 [Leptothrix cholodnii SP-6]